MDVWRAGRNVRLSILFIMYVHFVNDQTNHKQILNNWHVIDVILTFQKLNPCMKILITLQMSLLMNKSVLTGHYFNFSSSFFFLIYSMKHSQEFINNPDYLGMYKRTRQCFSPQWWKLNIAGSTWVKSQTQWNLKKQKKQLGLHLVKSVKIK